MNFQLDKFSIEILDKIYVVTSLPSLDVQFSVTNVF